MTPEVRTRGVEGALLASSGAMPTAASPRTDAVRAPEVTEALAGNDGALVAAWAAGFESVLHEPVAVEGFDGVLPGSRRVRVAPAAFEMPTLVGGTGHFRHMPGMAAHVRALGFDWGDDQRLWGFPTPATFNASLAVLAEPFAGPGAGFRVDWVRSDTPVLPMGRWLLRTMDGRLSLHLCSPGHYAEAVTSRHAASQVRFSLQSLVHDLTVHALNSHLVPREAIEALARRIEDALPARARAWMDDGAAAPLHLAYFYDNDFNRYCYAVWCRTREPAEFAPKFLKPAHLSQLVAALDARIAEIGRGLADGISGDTNEVQPAPGPEYRVD